MEEQLQQMNELMEKAVEMQGEDSAQAQQQFESLLNMEEDSSEELLQNIQTLNDKMNFTADDDVSLGQVIKDQFAQTRNSVTDTFMNVWDGAKEQFNSIVSGLEDMGGFSLAEGGIALGATILRDFIMGEGMTAGLLGMALDAIGVDWIIEQVFGLKPGSLDLGNIFRQRFKAGVEGVKMGFNQISTWLDTNVWQPLKSVGKKIPTMIDNWVISPFKTVKKTLSNWIDDTTRFFSTMPGRLQDQVMRGLPSALGGISDAEFFQRRLERQAEAGATQKDLSSILKQASQAGVGTDKIVSMRNQFSDLTGNADNQRAMGGPITEPVFGVGQNTGETYSFAEEGPEVVVPQQEFTPSVGGTDIDGSGDEKDEERNQLLKQIVSILSQDETGSGGIDLSGMEASDDSVMSYFAKGNI